MKGVDQLEFQFGCPFIEAEYYRDGAEDLIHRLLPESLIQPSSTKSLQQKTEFADLLPILRSSDLEKAPCSLSVLLLCKYRLNACNFFYDMISRWLLPQRRVNVELFFASDVKLPHLSDDLLSVAEIVIYLKSTHEAEEVRRSIRSIETEIRLGVVSDYHARRIIEFKGLSQDGKTAMIQEKIGSLIQSHSKDFDQGIFSQMQQFLVTCPEEFKRVRDHHHISRIISNLYSIRKWLKQHVRSFASKRHVVLKLFRTHLGKKPVLGVLAGLNFLKEHELFEAEQLATAIRKQLPQARLVPASSIVDPAKEPNLQTLYLEIEKEDGTDFTLEEIQKLKNQLPDQIKNHIEQLTHPIFMPRNEEEVLRNILSLSRQVRFVNDPPQLILSFDEPRGSELYFTVILLRVITDGSPSVQELLAAHGSEIKYLPDRVRKLGAVRRRHTKEATVFRTVVDAEPFRRPDRSVDLYQARQHIYRELVRALGDLRDFNGGMIYKQTEQLAALQQALSKVGHNAPLLVQKFFHALMPMEIRTSCEVDVLRQFYQLLHSATKTESRLPFLGSDFLFRQDAKKVLAILPGLDAEAKKTILQKIDRLQLPSHRFAHFTIDFNDATYSGMMLLESNKEIQNQFLSLLA